MKTHTQLVKRFFATLLISALVLGCPNSPTTGSFEDGRQAYKDGDYQRAFKIIQPFAEQGDPKAQIYIGTMYDLGIGVPQDYSEAAKWYRKAAEQGNAIAQINLGIMYRLGQGVPQNYIEAHKWYNLAASRFPPGEYHETALKSQNILKKKMTPAQVAEALKLVRKWDPKPNKSP